ncbi:MAG: cbb3-type cytochrome oxidase assembly protein CcoS [Saprospiraceae bacterium]|nr:cbb3-type cytochrome oxidase assembly protein CcoS [Saprospiraceae bacterium]MCB9324493.1 cbb3-type cytochrome oxidase assembly protein CcoS [Lewinellaceae bacterium]
MKVIFLLIFISLIVAIGFLLIFFWAVRSGQYDDDYTPSVRMLFDDDKPKTDEKEPLETDQVSKTKQ